MCKKSGWVDFFTSNRRNIISLLTEEIIMKQLTIINLVIFAEFSLCKGNPKFWDVPFKENHGKRTWVQGVWEVRQGREKRQWVCPCAEMLRQLGSMPLERFRGTCKNTSEMYHLKWEAETFTHWQVTHSNREVSPYTSQNTCILSCFS